MGVKLIINNMDLSKFNYYTLEDLKWYILV